MKRKRFTMISVEYMHSIRSLPCSHVLWTTRIIQITTLSRLKQWIPKTINKRRTISLDEYKFRSRCSYSTTSRTFNTSCADPVCMWEVALVFTMPADVQACYSVTPLVGTILTMMTSSNGNIFRVTGHLCGEFTGLRWIPRTKASDAELWCFLWSAPE